MLGHPPRMLSDLSLQNTHFENLILSCCGYQGTTCTRNSSPWPTRMCTLHSLSSPGWPSRNLTASRCKWCFCPMKCSVPCSIPTRKLGQAWFARAQTDYKNFGSCRRSTQHTQTNLSSWPINNSDPSWCPWLCMEMALQLLALVRFGPGNSPLGAGILYWEEDPPKACRYKSGPCSMKPLQALQFQSFGPFWLGLWSGCSKGYGPRKATKAKNKQLLLQQAKREELLWQKAGLQSSGAWSETWSIWHRFWSCHMTAASLPPVHCAGARVTALQTAGETAGLRQLRWTCSGHLQLGGLGRTGLAVTCSSFSQGSQLVQLHTISCARSIWEQIWSSWPLACGSFATEFFLAALWRTSKLAGKRFHMFTNKKNIWQIPRLEQIECFSKEERGAKTQGKSCSGSSLSRAHAGALAKFHGPSRPCTQANQDLAQNECFDREAFER